jgi:hypothetical protein
VLYESDDIIDIFTSQDKAERFKKQCLEHDNTEPEHGWLTCLQTYEKWKTAHPAGSKYDSYTISKRDLK